MRLDASTLSVDIGFGTGLTGVASGSLGVAGVVGIGTTTVPHGGVGAAKLAIEGTNASTAGPHMQFTTSSDDYPLIHILPYSHDAMSISFDAYWNATYKSSDAGSNFQIEKISDTLKFHAEAGIAVGNTISWTTAFQIESDAEVLFSPSAARKLYFRDSAIAISSDADGYLDLLADTRIDFNAGGVVTVLGILGTSVDIGWDNVKFRIGGGYDVEHYYNATDYIIDSGAVNPSDIVIDCGTNKTLELTESVWIDLNFAAGQAQLPTSSAPGVVTFTDNAAGDTGIATRGFAVGENLSYVLEYNHQCVTNGDMEFHVHVQCDDAPTGNDYIQFQIDYTVTHDGETCAAVTTITSGDVLVDTQYEQVKVAFTALTGINLAVGDQIKLTLSRIAASGDAYAGEAKLCTFGAHVEVDTLGSRQIGAK
jgi:hypothetical protein